MHDTVLMIMSVRNIQSIIDCYNNLNCEKIWFKEFTEYELVTHINNFIQNSNFQYYFIVSDDVYIHYDKFEELKLQLKLYPIVSAWTVHRQNSTFTTILNPNNFDKLIFNKLDAHSPTWPGWAWMPNFLPFAYKTHQIAALPDIIESAFTGWMFTGMHRKIWLEYPYNVFSETNSNSDLNFSRKILSDKKYKQRIIKSTNAIHISNTTSHYNVHYSFNNKQIIKTF